MVLSKYKTIIFINGCFWHGHKNCKAATLPQTRIKFWTDKITDNKKRDLKNYNDLTKSGWKVITIWQCQIKNKSIQERTLNHMMEKITN